VCHAVTGTQQIHYDDVVVVDDDDDDDDHDVDTIRYIYVRQKSDC